MEKHLTLDIHHLKLTCHLSKLIENMSPKNVTGHLNLQVLSCASSSMWPPIRIKLENNQKKHINSSDYLIKSVQRNCCHLLEQMKTAVFTGAVKSTMKHLCACKKYIISFLEIVTLSTFRNEAGSRRYRQISHISRTRIISISSIVFTTHEKI